MKFDATKLVRLKRPDYFAGQLLTAADLRAEQDYQREKQWLHNRMLHGYGVVVGLEVGVQENDDGSTQVIVSPGYALDGWGREVVVPEPLSAYLPGDRHDLTIYVRYVEHAADDAKTIASSSSKAGQAEPNAAQIVEGAQVMFEPSPTERALAPTTRSDFAIPIARLRRPHHNWLRDRDFRPARAK